MNHTRLLSLLLACAFAAGASGCFKPPRGMPNETVISYDGHGAVPPDCASLAQPSLLTDGGIRRPSMQWGCATYTNLAAQLAHPEDIVKPQTLGPADAAVAASAVRRYELGRVIPLDATTSRDSK
ncbi:CpaD family pilus assembly lipoprotein [Caballeronia humi]|uniref:Lipoprotein n=1 Tax=Caballeronia humi TaxID=326474 RepID=A0A158H6Q4_9BURK|nr:CpaD family pilus assembly lipoprotein [Caballeronia humi]SAL39771.1 lipoprotein [Caballeronia humi]